MDCKKFERWNLVLKENLNKIISKELNYQNAKSLFAEIVMAKKNNELGELCFECETCLDFNYYFSMLDKYVKKEYDEKELKIRIYEYHKLEVYGKYSNVLKMPNITEEDFKIEGEFDNSKLIVYFDMNVVNQYIDDKEFKELVFSSKNRLAYAYSPSHMEEISRMNSKHRVEYIVKLTNNLVMLPRGENIIKVYENPEKSLERIAKIPEFNNAVEQVRLAKNQEAEVYFPEFREQKHTRRVNNENVFSFYESEFNKIFMRQGRTYKISELRKGVKLSERDDIIECLYGAMDILSFWRDKGERKIKSGVYDIEHLKYGSWSNIFVTIDGSLANRATEIFQLINISVDVMRIEDFKKYLIEKINI